MASNTPFKKKKGSSASDHSSEGFEIRIDNLNRVDPESETKLSSDLFYWTQI